MRALSIRQPYAEQILRGTKKIEYRSQRTHIRGRVYIYASKSPGEASYWKAIKLEPGDLPIGVLVGTVEIVDCTEGDEWWHWHLKNPKRFAQSRKPKNKAQPVFFNPF